MINEAVKKTIEEAEIQDIEIESFLRSIYSKYGYDFKDYSRAFLKRRLNRCCSLFKVQNVSNLQAIALRDNEIFHNIVSEFSINVTEMFRFPSFFKRIREEIIPILKTYPSVKIWHPGCASGEEVYSLAILLKEEEILNKTIIYATDIDKEILKTAKYGIYHIEKIKEYTRNYQLSGGKNSFTDYYKARKSSVIINEDLKERIFFEEHNLVTDRAFGEMNMIMCRNVLIYFNKNLQNKVIELFLNSLARNGILGLGSKESLINSKYEEYFEKLFSDQKIYRRIK